MAGMDTSRLTEEQMEIYNRLVEQGAELDGLNDCQTSTDIANFLSVFEQSLSAQTPPCDLQVQYESDRAIAESVLQFHQEQHPTGPIHPFRFAPGF